MNPAKPNNDNIPNEQSPWDILTPEAPKPDSEPTPETPEAPKPDLEPEPNGSAPEEPTPESEAPNPEAPEPEAPGLGSEPTPEF